MYYQAFLKIYQRAAKKMCQDCQGFIEKKSRILDLGCGVSIVAKTFQDFFQAELIGVDVKDRRIFPIPFKKIDGRSLPFPENNFDAVLITYVLHHSQDPLSLLKEARRVTRDKILIYEDLAEGFFSGLFCKLHGISFNKIFDNRNKTCFKSDKAWQSLFKELGLRLVFQKKVSSIFNPVKKKLFVLEKQGT